MGGARDEGVGAFVGAWIRGAGACEGGEEGGDFRLGLCCRINEDEEMVSWV